MPNRYGLDVRIIGREDHHIFAEYGTSLLGTSRTKPKTVTTRIEAKTGEGFYIKIIPATPFPTNHEPENTLDETTPFDLMARVFVDGQDKMECSSTIFIDPGSRYYKHHGTILRGRFSKDSNTRNGELDIKEWAFKPVGIDVRLAQLDLNATPRTPAKNTEKGEVIAARKNTGDDTGNTASGSKVGRIEVQFVRVTIGERSEGQAFCEKKFVGNSETVPDMSNAGTEVSHYLGVGGESRKISKTVQAFDADWYKQGEEVYAKFVFHYMSREKLMKLGLMHENGTPVVGTRLRGNDGTSLCEKRHAEDEHDEEDDFDPPFEKKPALKLAFRGKGGI